MSFPRYPKYKPSGVEWLGNVPEHWEIVRIKRLGRLQSGESITSDAITAEGNYPVYGGNGLRGYSTAFTHDGSYVLIGRQGALCGNVNYADGKFWASEHAVVVHPHRRLNVRWFGELLRAMNLNQYSISAAQPGLAVDAISALWTTVPPPDEQRAIAVFLDWETAKIDALVAEQERLIELLKEKRQAVISHAVTKGLDPTAPMKPSGIEWLGDVPAHWEVSKLKHSVPAITVGIVVEPSKYYADEGVPALRSLNVRPGRIVLDELVFISEAANELHSKSKLRTGDLVAVRSGQPGTAAVIPEELDGSNCVDLIIIRRPADNTESFLCWFLASDAARAQVLHGSDGAIQQHFNVSTAGQLRHPAPPLGEKLGISSRLSRVCGQLDELIHQSKRAVELLHERRSALISAAVTGQIDVREAVPVEVA